MLTHLDLKLRQIVRRVPGVVEVGYDDLATSDGAARVFEHALGLPFDAGWYEALRGVNLQEPFVTFERYAVAYLPQLTRMAGLAKGAALRDMAQARTERSDDGVSFAEEEPSASAGAGRGRGTPDRHGAFQRAHVRVPHVRDHPVARGSGSSRGGGDDILRIGGYAGIGDEAPTGDPPETPGQGCR